MLAAAAALSGSVDSAVVAAAGVPAAHLPVVVPAPVPRVAELPLLLQLLLAAVLVVARVPPQPLLHLRRLRLPRVVVESEGTLHLRGRQSWSAAMARRSPPTVP